MRDALPVLVMASAAAMACAANTAHGDLSGYLENTDLAETSGLARSQSRTDLLWAVNDSGNPAVLYALGLDGADRGSVRVLGAANRDWEDLASLQRDGQPYLLIADTGDNAARRGVSFLYLVAEPEPDASGRFTGTVRARRLVFRYEDGPRDCEAVAVDPHTGEVLLVAKRTAPPALYALSLPADDEVSGPLTARRLGTVGGLPSPTPRELLEAPLGPFRHQPTALDISADGREALLATYQRLYLYRRAPRQSWAAALARPVLTATFPLEQVEAAAFVGPHAIAIAEGRGAAVRRWPLSRDPPL